MKEVGKLYQDENKNLLFDDGEGGFFCILAYQRPPKIRVTLTEVG